jgi:hypothetical protein
MLRAILTLTGVGIASSTAMSQPLDDAVPTIFLPRVGGEGTTPMEVAYLPSFDRYYASNGGNPGFSAWTYDAAGNLVSGPTPAGADVRSMNYNPNTGFVEVVQFGSSELRVLTVDGAGNWVDAGGVPGVIITKPDAQSMPAYNPDANELYAYSSSGSSAVSIISRESGNVTGEIGLDLAGAGIPASNLASWASGYDPANRWLLLFDAVNDDVVVFDLSGQFIGASSVATDVDPAFRSGYANGQVFIFDVALNGWQGYVIGEAGCAADFNGDGALNILDFVDFQTAFVGGDPAADCDQNGLFNILDFVCFQGVFGAGCP